MHISEIKVSDSAKSSSGKWRGSSLWTSLLCGILSLLVWQAAEAAPFRDLVLTFNQPDGTQVKVIGWGDEFASVFETLDGYTVVYDPARKAYCYAQRSADGHLVSTDVQIQQGDPVAMGLTKHVRMDSEIRKQQFIARWQKWDQAMQVQKRWEERKAAIHQAAVSGIAAAPPSTTTLGNKYGLCLLIDFDDDPSTVPQAEIVNFCNGDNYTGYGNNGSVKKYYQDVSNGLLTYSNIVTAYVRIPNSTHPKSYYNDITKDAGSNANYMIADAITILKGLPNYTTEILPTLNSLTVDANNQVIACNVFYAGDNGNTWMYGLWPHSWDLEVVGAQDLSNGMKLWRYQVSNIGASLELGTFCHENGHMLCGYPDLYDYDYDSVGGAGDFCLMAFGNSPGNNPVQICAYLKRASGWTTTTELDSSSAVNAVVTDFAGTNFNHFYRFQKPGVTTEYYLAECRYAMGRDSSLPASGVAIWHVDELGDRDNQSLVPNSIHANYELTLVQADNLWDFEHYKNAGDLNDLYYDGNMANGYNNTFTDFSGPSANWWDGTPSGANFHGFSEKAPTMTFTVGTPTTTFLAYQTNRISGGNGNGIIDFNECNTMDIVITNQGARMGTGVKGVLSSTTPGVFIAQAATTFPDVPPSTAVTNRTSFKVSTSQSFIPGTTIKFSLVITCDEGTQTNFFQVATGHPGLPVRFDSSNITMVPAGDTNGVTSAIVVGDLGGAISKVTASVYITSPLPPALTLELIAPDGTTVKLAEADGGVGTNFGVNCDLGRTVFDDNGLISIDSGIAPFVGVYAPQQPLRAFIGKSGTNVIGNWKLRVTNPYAYTGVSVLNCWSLNLTPSVGTDGGGECPGVDLSVVMTAQPNPVSVGSPLTYTMLVSNAGPSTAKGVVLSQNLPADSLFESAALSQGSFSLSSGVLSMTLGSIQAAGTATVTVVVIPNKSGTVSSVATVGSPMTDYNPDNDWSSVISVVEEARADLALLISGSPDPVLAGGLLTYTVKVNNRGPSSAANVMVTNTLPISLSNVVVTTSQGTYVQNDNLVLAVLGTMDSGARATMTISGNPMSVGQITATARVVSDQSDPLQGNNQASVTTLVNPAADIAVSISDMPNPVVVNGSLTYKVTIRNLGPGVATDLRLAYALPADVQLTGINFTQGSITTNTTGLLSGSLGTLAVGSNAVIMVQVVAPSTPETLVSSATVSSSQGDPNTANNVATSSTAVMLPLVVINPFGASLIAESFTPTNGVIDPNERVTVQLAIKNGGTITATNVMVALQPTGGVLLPAPSDWQNVGNLDPSATATNMFAFTATNSGNSIAATLLVRTGVDGSGLFTNVFTFAMPDTKEFSNTNAITIPSIGLADPYPSAISVSGITGIVSKVTAKLVNFGHGFPNDVSALLVSPAGRSVILMAHASADGVSVSGLTLTFDDAAATAIPASGALSSGSYQPGVYGTPVFTNVPGAKATHMAAFNGANPNGVWSLFVLDDAAGDSGAIANGWSLDVTTIAPDADVADLAVSASASATNVIVGDHVAYTFVVTNNGPSTAKNIYLTNQLPTGLSFESSSANGLISGQTFTCNVGDLPVGASVAITNYARILTMGSLTATVSVGGAEIDVNGWNNSASADVVSGAPVADVAVSIDGSQTATTGSGISYTITAANNGPNDALAVVITNVLPAGVVLDSATASQGAKAVSKTGVLTCALGTIASGSSATVQVKLIAAAPMTVTNVVLAGTASTDPNLANNLATLVTTVSLPSAVLAANGTTLQSESFAPSNGAIDPGETVTVLLCLTNQGDWTTTNLIGTLETNAAVTATDVVQNYGAIPPGGNVFRAFTFTASASATDPLVLTLDLTDGGRSMGTVSYTFGLPSVQSFANTNAIIIADSGPATPYPAAIAVSGVTGSVSQATVTLKGLSHSFPSDVEAILVSPAGEKLVLMARAGGAFAVNGVTLTFTNMSQLTSLPTGPIAHANSVTLITNPPALPFASQIVSGVYLPGNYAQNLIFPGDPSVATVSDLSGFNGVRPTCPSYPSGNWSLFIYDANQGDGGIIAGGWSLDLAVIHPVSAMADLAVQLTAPSVFFTDSYLCYTNTVVNNGPGMASHVVVKDALPTGLTLVSVTSSQGVCNTVSNVVSCDFGTVAAGASVQLVVKVLTVGPGSVFASAAVSSDVYDINPANDMAQQSTLIMPVAACKFRANHSKDSTEFVLEGQAGAAYTIQTSTNLTSWTDVTNFVMPDAGFTLKDSAITNSETTFKFYRAVRIR